MFRIDSEGATIDNKFTEGDPGLSIPATVVSDEWLNHVQEEFSQFIEYTGITLSKLDDNQFQKALLEFFLMGGSATPVSQALNNNAGPLDVVGFDFDSAAIRGKIAFYNIERKTDTQNVQEVGLIFITRDSADSLWRISNMSFHDDAGVVFSEVLDSGTLSKLQYTTHDLTGTTYSGQIDLTAVFEFRI